MAFGDAHVFPGFLTLVLTQLFFPKPPTTYLTCFCRGERRKNAGKKVHLNWVLKSQPRGHESDTLTTERPLRQDKEKSGQYSLILTIGVCIRQPDMVIYCLQNCCIVWIYFFPSVDDTKSFLWTV